MGFILIRRFISRDIKYLHFILCLVKQTEVEKILNANRAFTCVETELDASSLNFIIDISRPSEEHDSEEKIIKFFGNLEARLKQKDGTFKYKPVNLSKGIDYTKDYPEIMLSLNT